MKKYLFFLILFFSFSLIPADSFAKEAKESALLSEFKSLTKQWKNYTPCQKLFIFGYLSYVDGKFSKAREYFSACDGKYPILQDYITEFIQKSAAGGEAFSCLDTTEAILNEIKNLEKNLPDKQTVYDLAKAYFKARDYKNALEFFRESAEYDQYRLSSLEYIATSLARLERYEEAIEANRGIIKEFPKNNQTVLKALYKIGFLQLDGGDYDSARATFERLQRLGKGYQKEQVEWYLAWCDYKTGRYSSAIKKFEVIAKRGGKSFANRGLFWKGMAQEASGDKDGADSIYRSIYSKSPVSYYGIVSSIKLGETFTPPQNLADYEEYVENISEPFSANGDGGVLDKAKELDYLGLSNLVVDELAKVAGTKKKEIAWEEFRKLAIKNNGWNLLYPKVPYPKAYERYVFDSTKKTGVEPYFVWAIMREESTFRPKVVSPSGAMGLMQLMPFTAKRMSAYSFRLENLFIPKINIDTGTRYLSFLMKRYKNNLYLAAAGYNAGEEAVDRWVKNGLPKDLQETLEFVEEIPYKETNDYVKKVMKSYWVYKTR